MRLAGCLMIEVVAAAAWLAGAGLAGTAAALKAREVIAAHHGRRAGAPAGAAPSLRPRQDLSAEEALGSGTPDAPGTFLGMSDEILLERLRTQPVTRLKLNHG